MDISNQFQRGLRSSWAESHRLPAPASHRSGLAAPAVPPRSRRPLPLELANRSARLSVAPRFESIGLSGAIKNRPQRPHAPVHAIKAQAKSGLAVWQQIVIAAYLEKHISEPVKVHALARYVYLSSTRFRRAFKRSFGLTLHRYLVQQRIERAKELLLASKWSIAEIALAFGFSRTTSFSTAFRKVTGTTPTVFRLNQQRL